VVSLVEKIWPGSKATRERVEVVAVVVVLVLALVLVRVDHMGYYDHVPHFHHCCHHHHHHQPRQRPIWDYPYVACVLQMKEGDCPCVECALLWKEFGKFDFPPTPAGTEGDGRASK